MNSWYDKTHRMSLTSAKYLSTKMSAKCCVGSCNDGALFVCVCTGEEVAGLEGGAGGDIVSKCQIVSNIQLYDFSIPSTPLPAIARPAANLHWPVYRLCVWRPPCLLLPPPPQIRCVPD